MLEKLLNLFTSICSLNLLQILAIYGFVFLILFSIYLVIVSIYSFKITWNDILASRGVERFAFCFLSVLPMISALIFAFLCFDFFISHDKKDLLIYVIFGLAVLLYKMRHMIKYHEPLSIIMEIAQTVLEITELKKHNSTTKQPPVIGKHGGGKSMVIHHIQNSNFKAFKEFFDINDYDFSVLYKTKSGVAITCAESYYILYCQQK